MSVTLNAILLQAVGRCAMALSGMSFMAHWMLALLLNPGVQIQKSAWPSETSDGCDPWSALNQVDL